jgi:hypothetical protein
MNKDFETNLLLIERNDPHLAALLRKIVPSRYQLTQTREGEKNLALTIEGKEISLHSQYSAKKEAINWAGSFEGASMSKVLFVYGIGLGYGYLALKEWLQSDPERYLVFLEDELEVLFHLLHTEVANEILESSQVFIGYLDPADKDQRRVVCEDFATYTIGLPFEVSALPAYRIKKEDSFLEVKTAILHSAAYVSFAGQEFMDFGSPFFRNFYLNTLCIHNSYSPKHLYGAFEGVPAIICGAGPSLNKNFELLKTLRNRAILFAGGSAIPALTNRGLVPHFGGSVDPNHLQFQRMINQSGFELPMFYKGRTYFQALQAIHGPRLYLAGNNCYPITKWFEKNLGIDDPEATEGHNVLHLQIDIARMMGCNPIIFVGMDLAFSEFQEYAAGVVANPKVNKTEITKGNHLNSNAFIRKDIYGNDVYTLWKWVAESEYTSSQAVKFKGTTYINCTEGGLGFNGIPNMTLQEAEKKYLSQIHELDGEIHELIQMGKFDFSQSSVIDLIRELDKSFERSIEICKELGDEIKILQRAIAEHQIELAAKSSKKIEHIQVKLGQELACEQVLDPVNHMRSILFDRKLDQIQKTRQDLTEMERVIGSLEENRKEIETLQAGAEMNRMIIKLSFQELDHYYCESPANSPADSIPLTEESASERSLFYADGTHYAIQSLKNREPEGKQLYFYPNQIIKSEYHLHNGLPDGAVKLYYPNGKLKWMIPYEYGLKHGLETLWSPQGLPMIQKIYENGILVLERSWDHKGKLVEEKSNQLHQSHRDTIPPERSIGIPSSATYYHENKNTTDKSEAQ